MLFIVPLIKIQTLTSNVIIFPNSTPNSQILHHFNIFLFYLLSLLSVILHLLIILIHWNSVQREVFTLSPTTKGDIALVSGNLIVARFGLRLGLTDGMWRKVCMCLCMYTLLVNKKKKQNKTKPQKTPSQILLAPVRNYLKLQLFYLVHNSEEC